VAVVNQQTTVADLSSLKILLAEDNTVNIFFMKQLFKRWNITADYAENGRVAVDMHLQNDYDLILMDMYMPEMDGIEATKSIRKLTDPQKKDIYIIALTASVSGDIQRRVKESGINDYLQKPFQLDALREKLEKALIYR
ncbi:MAG: response regulator, partial [Sphingobacteriales bacterium]